MKWKFVNRFLYRIKKLGVHHVHDVPMCPSCHKAILLITSKEHNFCKKSKKVFRTNKNLILFKKCPIFFILTVSTNIKIRMTKFEAGCSYKDCSLFLLYSVVLKIIVHGIRSFILIYSY